MAAALSKNDNALAARLDRSARALVFSTRLTATCVGARETDARLYCASRDADVAATHYYRQTGEGTVLILAEDTCLHKVKGA